MPRITITDLADLIALLPYQLGFHPRDSLVLADVTQRRLHGISRVDLDEVRTLDLAAQCLRPLVRDGARQVVLVAWEDTPGAATGPLDLVCRAALDLGVEVVREVLVCGDRFWSSGEGEPPEGRLVPPPGAVAGVAEMVALGIAPLPGRESLAERVAPVVGERADRVGAEVRRRRERPRSSWSSRVAREEWRAWLTGLVRDDPAPGERMPSSPERSAVLAVALLDRDWRDGLVAWLCAGSLPLDNLPSRIVRDLRGLPRIPPPPDRSARSDAGDGRPPGWHRLRLVEGVRDVDGAGGADGAGGRDGADPAEAGGPMGSEGEDRLLDGVRSRTLLEALFALCRDLPDDSEDVAAAALTLSAHVAWWLGDGALARTALERALEVCPGYRLAELLTTVVAVGIRPALLA